MSNAAPGAAGTEQHAKLSGWQRVLITLTILGLLALSWTAVLERNADARLGAVLERALVTAALARGLNGVISVAQGTEIAVQPIGVGVTITAGQILDPLNDLVERFSWLALIASASLGTQLLLTEIATESMISVIVSVLAGFFLLSLWWPGDGRGQALARAWLLRILALALLLRFLFTIVSLTVGWVDAWVLESRQQAALAELSVARDELEALQQQELTQNLETETSLRDRFESFLDESRQLLDIEAQLNALEARTESAIEHLLELIVLFLVQTLIVPIAAFWLAVAAFRHLLSRLRLEGPMPGHPR